MTINNLISTRKQFTKWRFRLILQKIELILTTEESLPSLVATVAAEDVGRIVLEGGQAQECIQQLANVCFRLEEGAEIKEEKE